MDNLLSSIISSKTRAKLLVRFFINPKSHAYLRELEREFNVSTNALRVELNHLTRNNLLNSRKNGRQILYEANTSHALFPELSSMVNKVVGIDKVIDHIINRLKELNRAYLIDDYAVGKDTGIIDLLLVGNINPHHLTDLTIKTERYIKRRIRALIVSPDEYRELLPQIKHRPTLLIWENRKAIS